MEYSPSRSTLYRTACWLVILASLLLIALSPTGAQIGRPKISKGPRALALVELPPKGDAHLTPIAILVDGQFYDAGAYKASPVPMALWSETVYEAVRSGVSQGLFTVTTALQNQRTNEWMADGRWQPAGSIPAKSAKKTYSSEPRGLNEDEGPPVLRHSGPKAPQPAPSAPQNVPQPPTSGSSNPAMPPPATTQAAPAPGPATPPSPPPDQEDKDRPVLKRGKPASKPPEPLIAEVPPAKSPMHSPASAISAKAAQVRLIPAISDAGGPEPQSYVYELKPDEEQQFRKKMLALAADEVRARAKQLASTAIGSSEPARSSSRRARPQPARPLLPDFEDAQLSVFDLSSSNEPTLVLTATARMPQTQRKPENPDLQYFVTLVAREDINGDFHKAFSNVSDSQHLDVLPRFELIDAVDVDGDGRGELLFRQISDAGSAFVVYRVIGDQLYPLFQGSPG